MQADFLGQVLPHCHEAGIHVALDTCGLAPWERYERVMPFVSLILLDIKLSDSTRHRETTGVDNALILGNARRMAERGRPLWIRTPVIPGYTDDLDNIRAIGKLIRESLPTVERWDLLAYTNLGRPKYHRLDLPYALDEIPLVTRQEMEALHSAAAELVPAARWSGATR